MLPPEDEKEIDWDAIEASISPLRPEKVPFPHFVRLRVEDQLEEYRRRLEIKKTFVPKSEVFRECDAIAGPAYDLVEALGTLREKNGEYLLLDDEGSPTENCVSIEKIVRILNSIIDAEQGYARLIDKYSELDPVPPRKRLGIALFLLGEQEFGLSSKRTTPPDRGAGRLPTGELFPFVAAVLRAIGEEISATTLEQWSRDAQHQKRIAEVQHLKQEARRAAELEKYGSSGGIPGPVGDIRPWFLRTNAGLYSESISRDWLFLDDETK